MKQMLIRNEEFEQIEDEGEVTSLLNKPASDPANLQLVDEFPNYTQIAHGDLLSLGLSINTTSYTHGLHRFPAKYIPQVPRWVIKQFATSDSIVLDPFAGSGTSVIEGLCVVQHTYGIDIDPLARLISRAKTERYDIQRINQISEAILRAEDEPVGECFLPMSGVKNVDHWFTHKTWRELCQIYTAIERTECLESEKDLFLCIFSSILRWVSNADDQTQKTYVSGTLAKTPPPVWETFKRALNKAINGIVAFEKVRGSGKSDVLDSSALDIALPDSSVDLIVTSPPYLDSVDYMYNFMLEYFWLGPKLGVSSRAEYNARRRSSVGAKNPTEKNELPAEVEDLVNVHLIPAYRKDATLAYFNDMRTHFIEAARVMKDGARYALVVGNSQAQSGVIPVHDCLIRLARAAGLHLEKAFAYRIRRHYMKFPRKGRGGIILMDWIIILKKTDTAILANEDRLPLPNISIGNDEVAH